MNILLGNIGTIFSNIINWLGQTASSLITNPIFIIIMAVIILRIIWNILCYQTLKWDMKRGIISRKF